MIRGKVMDFKERLKKALDLRGMTAYQLSVKTSISRSSICLYLQGKRTPKTEQIYRMASALEISVSYLLGLTNSIIDPVIRPLNTLGEKSEKEIVIDEITANLTWLDIDTLKNLNAMVKAITKDKK